MAWWVAVFFVILYNVALISITLFVVHSFIISLLKIGEKNDE